MVGMEPVTFSGGFFCFLVQATDVAIRLRRRWRDKSKNGVVLMKLIDKFETVNKLLLFVKDRFDEKAPLFKNYDEFSFNDDMEKVIHIFKRVTIELNKLENDNKRNLFRRFTRAQSTRKRLQQLVCIAKETEERLNKWKHIFVDLSALESVNLNQTEAIIKKIENVESQKSLIISVNCQCPKGPPQTNYSCEIVTGLFSLLKNIRCRIFSILRIVIWKGTRRLIGGDGWVD